MCCVECTGLLGPHRQAIGTREERVFHHASEGEKPTSHVSFQFEWPMASLSDYAWDGRGG